MLQAYTWDAVSTKMSPTKSRKETGDAPNFLNESLTKRKRQRMKNQIQSNGKGCEFCDFKTDKIIAERKLAFAIYDKFPVTPLHCLVIPKRHVSSFFDLQQSEIHDILKVLDSLRADISTRGSRVEGFNVGVNIGEAAGQTIYHCHVHLIPRRRDDVENPRGGVRGVIPRKQSH